MVPADDPPLPVQNDQAGVDRIEDTGRERMAQDLIGLWRGGGRTLLARIDIGREVVPARVLGMAVAGGISAGGISNDGHQNLAAESETHAPNVILAPDRTIGQRRVRTRPFTIVARRGSIGVETEWRMDGNR